MNVTSKTRENPNDLRTLSQLRSVIERDGRIPRLDVDIDVEDGVVELLGVIPDEREHDALLALVAFAARNKPIVDHLIVSGSSIRTRKSRGSNSSR
jgi:hypothetical protein